MLRKALVALALVVLSLTTAGAQVTDTASQSVVLRPGDALRVTVWRQPELSGEYEITSDGTIRHPVFQQVQVVGVPQAEIVSRLRTVLLRYSTNPEFVAVPLLRVMVGGEVLRPSLYAFPPEMTIAQAVASAGGISPRGRLSAVRLIRDGRQTTINLASPDIASARLTVRSGDQIIVPQRQAVAFREFVAPFGALVAAGVSLISLIAR
ncbi:MAG: polysaccharide biosynthesis/export family protein [Gemmatimonadetes bacterium]|nr:polysaccharide biosynthesis/export family protein [Gemmatimonadota bacterium]